MSLANPTYYDRLEMVIVDAFGFEIVDVDDLDYNQKRIYIYRQNVVWWSKRVNGEDLVDRPHEVQREINEALLLVVEFCVEKLDWTTYFDMIA